MSLGIITTPSTSPKTRSPGCDDDAAAGDRHVHRHHLAAPARIERSDAAMEHRKAHRPDLADVAHQAVGDAARRPPRPRGGRQEFAPGCDPLGRAVAAEDRDIVGLEVVDQRDLYIVGVLALGHRIGVHVEAGAGPAEHHQCVVERADEGSHRLAGAAEAVEHVGQDRGIEHCLERGEIDGHGGLLQVFSAEHRACRHQEAHRQEAERGGEQQDERDQRVDVRREAKPHHRPEPDRQGALRAGDEQRDHRLVEGQREGEDRRRRPWRSSGWAAARGGRSASRWRRDRRRPRPGCG